MTRISKALAVLLTISVVITIMKIVHFHFFSLKSEDGRNVTAFESSQEDPALLTIFTTFKEIKIIPHHKFAQALVLTNWPLFKPYVRPVLFLNFTNSTMAKRARAAGWDVLRLNRSNSAGTPYLKDMFRAVFERYDSLFYGYANGDLLFDGGLLKTLKAIKRRINSLNNNILITGRRTNVQVNLSDPRWNSDVFTVERLKQLAIKKGSLIGPAAIDYFFFSKGCSLNWSSLVDVVIGRPAYDSYLVGTARHQGVNVIDCSETLLAVHISQIGITSHGRLTSDSKFNARLIGNFRHRDGFPTSAKLATTVDFDGNVFIIRRK